MKLNLNKLRTLIELSFEMKILEDLRSQWIILSSCKFDNPYSNYHA